MLPSALVTLEVATISALRPAIKFQELLPLPAGVNEASGAVVNGLSYPTVVLVSLSVK